MLNNLNQIRKEINEPFDKIREKRDLDCEKLCEKIRRKQK